MIQARNGGIRLARKVTEDDITRWEELRDKGYTYERIGKETEWNPETVRKYIGGERKPPEKEKKELEGKKQESELSTQAKVFKMFEDGKGPVDVVKEGIATSSEVKVFWREYHELKNLNPPEERLKKIEKWIDEAIGEITNFWFLVANDIIGKPCPVAGCGGEIRWKSSSDGVEKEGYYCTNWKKDKTGCYFRIIEPYEW